MHTKRCPSASFPKIHVSKKNKYQDHKNTCFINNKYQDHKITCFIKNKYEEWKQRNRTKTIPKGPKRITNSEFWLLYGVTGEGFFYFIIIIFFFFSFLSSCTFAAAPAFQTWFQQYLATVSILLKFVESITTKPIST